MANYLDKSKILMDRDENGKLLPKDVVLETVEDKPTVKIIPMMKGELTKVFNGLKDDPEMDAKIIAKHCVEPSFTEDEAKHIKMANGYSDAIIIAILSLSTGKTQQELQLMFEGGQKADESNFTTTEQK